MTRQKVSSSNINSIGFDSSTSILEVEFKHGSIYQYSNVPASIYNALMAASSHGKYLNAHVKGVYGYKKIR